MEDLKMDDWVKVDTPEGAHIGQIKAGIITGANNKPETFLVTPTIIPRKREHLTKISDEQVAYLELD